MLVEEGILSLELTLTTPDLLDSLPELVNRYRDDADVGVGTVLDTDEAEQAIDAGAQYLVTPTMNLPVIELAVRRRVAVFPGGLTPTELAARLGRRRHRGQDLPRPDRRRGLPQAPPRPVPRPAGRPLRRGRPHGHRQWLAAGAVAVSLGGPLLGDALTGGDLAALRDRCRAVRAVVDDRRRHDRHRRS